MKSGIKELNLRVANNAIPVEIISLRNPKGEGGAEIGMKFLEDKD